MHLVCAKFVAVVRSCLTESPGHDFEAASHLSGEGLPRFISSPDPLMCEPPVLGLPFFFVPSQIRKLFRLLLSKGTLSTLACHTIVRNEEWAGCS